MVPSTIISSRSIGLPARLAALVLALALAAGCVVNPVPTPEKSAGSGTTAATGGNGTPKTDDNTQAAKDAAAVPAAEVFAGAVDAAAASDSSAFDAQIGEDSAADIAALPGDGTTTGSDAAD